MYKKLTLILSFAFAFLGAKAAYTPVTLTGYKVDIVANGSGPASASTSSTVPAASTGAFLIGNYAFMAPDFNPAGTTPTSFLPANGLINSASTPGLSFQLAPYTGNNSIMISNAGTDSLVFATPATAGEVDVLATSGDGSKTVSMVVNFTDGTSQTFSQSVNDWYGGTNYAILGLGRVNLPGATTASIGNDASNPRLYEYKLGLSATNYTKLIRSVSFTVTATGSELVVMAISTAPPCSGAAVAGTASSTSGANACPNVAFTLSLAGYTAGPGITYQWQSNTGTGWSDISGASTASYTVSAGQTIATSYRAYVRCTASAVNADTSNVLAIGMNSPSQCYCIPTATSASYYISNFTTTGATANVNNTSGAGTTSMGYSDFTAQTISAVQGSTVNFSSTFANNTFGAKIYVDWNQNGTFESSEQLYTTTSYVSSISGNFTVPLTANPGSTRLRVIADEASNTAAYAPCAFNSGLFGEAEDYTFTVVALPPCTAPTAQPTALSLIPGYSIVNGSFTAASPAADKYLVLRTTGTATPSVAPAGGYTYVPGATLGNATVVAYGTATTFYDAGLTGNTQYRYTVYSVASSATCGPTYLLTNPLTSTTTTSTSPTVYTWNATTGNADWTLSTSWTPARQYPDPGDILQFTNGGTSTATNIPTQTVRRIVFNNNTTANFQTAAAATLTMASDNDPTTNELNIAQGSSLVSNGTTAALTLAFSGTGATGRTAGTLEVSNTGTPVNIINFTNAIDTVTATGTIANGGTTGTACITSSATSLVVNGTYNYKYTTAAGTIPTATWNTGSTVAITGITTATGNPSGLGQTFYNFTYACPLQTANTTWSTIPTTINGTLTVDTTGTNEWQWSATTAATINNFSQVRGIFNMGTSSTGKAINIGGNFNQVKGLLKVTGTGAVTLNFNGSAAQTANFVDSSATGPVIYRLNNAAGVTLTGTGLFTSTPAFKLNNGGGVQVTTATANPLTTTLALTYLTGSTLTYDASANTTPTANVWTTTNGPINVTTNLSATAPANRLIMPFSRSIPGTLTITNGVIILNNNDLSITNNASGAISVTGSATKMIATTGTGQLKRAIATTTTSYLFPVGDTVGTIDYSPTTINFVSNAAARNIGVRVVNAKHPNDLSTIDYISRYWAFTDDGGAAAYTYNGSFTYPTADVVGTESNIRLNLWKNNTAWSQIPSTPSSGTLTITGPVQYSAALPLGGNQVTGRQFVATTNTYTWNGVTSTDWQDPTNWTPNRNVPDISDILQFNNAIVDTVKNIPTQTVTRLLFTNNTTGVFQTAAASTLTFASDNVATTNELDIAAGSSLINNSTAAALTFAFSGTGGTSRVAGNLEIANASVANAINFTNTIDTVTATGTLAAGGATAGTITSTAANLVINGTFNYKYTSVAGAVPTATWGTGSTVLISGVTTATANPSGLGQTFYNFKYACPLQTVNTVWSTTPTTINGTFTVDTTGTNEWQWSATSGTTVNNYAQTRGIFNVNTSTTAKAFNVAGSFNQTKGVLKVTGTGVVTLNFNGTTGAQSVNFVDSSVTGPVIYQVSNYGGINLTGSGALTTGSAFKINSNGGVRVTTTSTNPINTTLALTYAATATTLSYDTTGSMYATAAVWPAANGPLNVTVNSGNSSNILNMPASFPRTINGTLTMTSGDINVGANTLTLGTSATSAGTLTYTAGNIRLTTGSFVRWYGNATLPTSAVTGVGFYPVAFGGANRNVNLYFSAASITTGGSIGVSHTNAGGLFTLSPSVADGAYNIDKRTNAYWSFSQSGLALGTATISMTLTGTGLLNSANPANLRVMQANAVAGTHLAGSGVTARRTGLALTDLASNYYIGAAAVDIGGVYVAINNGPWGTGSTWDIGTPPGIGNDAFINPGVTVTADALNDSAKSLTIYSGGTLTVNTNTVTIDSILNNNGTVNVGGGTLTVRGNTGIVSGITNNGGSIFNVTAGTATLGPVGGSNKPFTHNSGATLNVTGGTLNINGNMVTNTGSFFNQSGGNINVDGNAAGVAANSVACGTPIVSLKSSSLTLTGGTFTIVDPHACTSGNNTFEYNNGTTVSAGGTHTFNMGDGVSADAGGQTPYNFSVNTNIGSGKFSFNNIVVNAGTATNSAVCMGASNTGVLGNITVNSGGELRVNNNNTLYLNGNLTVNTGGTFTASTTAIASTPTAVLYFGNYSTGSAAPATSGAQVVSGSGTFRNTVTGSTANFASITVSNSAGVTFNMTNPAFSKTLNFVAGASGPTKLITTPGNAIIEIGGAGATNASQANGWVYGRYQKTAGTTGGFNGTLPVGDASYYAFVNFSAGTVATTGAVWASTTTLDHPNINTSTINPTKSVNRYYTIGLVNGLTFTAGTVAANFNWNAADVDAGATTANFKVGNYASSAWTYPTIGSNSATSVSATGMTLSGTSDFQVGEQCAAINITTQPLTHFACLGSADTFKVALTSTSGVTYQWQKNGTNITGATNANYIIPAVASTDAGSYAVILGSNCTPVTGVTSATATLSINTPAAITTQPVAQNICENSPVTFSVAATGTNITYQWQKNGSNITGATNTTYTIPVTATTDAGNYSVMVIGASPCGSVASSTVTLTIKPLPLTIAAAGNTTFCAGGSVTINASTTPSTLTYGWNLNGSPITPAATNASYIATAAGNYTATITNTANGCTGTSNTVTVINATPVSTITPAGTAAFCQNGSVTLSGPTVAGINYQWKLNGTAIPGATNATYAANVAGNYTLDVSTSPTCVGTSSTTVVTMNPLPNITVTPSGNQAICQGQTLQLCATPNTGLTFQWSNGSSISGATQSCYTTGTAGSYTVTATNTTTGCQNTSAATVISVNPLPTATVTAATATTFCQGGSVVLNANPTGMNYTWNLNGTPIVPAATGASYTANASGNYSVTVTNPTTTCQATSAATTVTVNQAPNVTVSVSNGTTICQGQSTNLCIPSAGGVTYQWSLNGTPITGATQACYSATQAGSYTVTATTSSSSCTATSTAKVITVNPVPVATATAQGATTICQGDTVWISGTGGPSYQWNKNGSPIAGATSQLYPATSTGIYTVTTTNSSNCSTTSANVTVTVNPRPTVGITYTTPITFCQGGAVVLNAVSNTGVTYQWQNNGAPMAGATNNYYIASSSGNYTVTVTNTFGCSATAATPTVVVANPLPQPVISRTGNTLTTGNYATYQWYRNSTPISNATFQSYTFTQNGAYEVYVTDVNNCSAYSSVTFVNNVGVKNVTVSGADIKVYPNPTRQVINIDAPVKVNVMIRDLQGRLILEQKDAKQIDLGDIADGFYMMQITDTNGQLLKIEKLQKQQ